MRTDKRRDLIGGWLAIAGLVVAAAGVAAMMQVAAEGQPWQEKIAGKAPPVGKIVRDHQTVNPYRYEAGHWRTPELSRTAPETRIPVPHGTYRDYRELLTRMTLHHNGRIDSRSSRLTPHMDGHYRLVVYGTEAAHRSIADLAAIDGSDQRGRYRWADSIPKEPVPMGTGGYGLKAAVIFIEEEPKPGWGTDARGFKSSAAIAATGVLMLAAGVTTATRKSEENKSEETAPNNNGETTTEAG